MSIRAEILSSTHELSHEQWLLARKKGIGGSDVAKITGHSKYGTKLTVYLDKTGQLPEQEVGEAAYWGVVMEPLVASRFTEVTGIKVRRKNAILQHPKFPWMLANVDRLVVGADEGLECKTASEYLKNEWKDDEVPDAYYFQCQHYMAITGYNAWWIAVLIGGNKFVYKRIERDEEVIQALIRIEGDFWNNHVVPQVPPELDGTDVSTQLLKRLHPMSNGEEMQLPPEAKELIEQLEVWKSELKKAEQFVNEAENKIKQLLGDCEIGWYGDKKVVWKSVTSNRIDSTRLKKELPDVYERFIKPSVSRRFEIK